MKVLFLAKQTESSKKALEYLIKRKIDIMFAVIRKGDDVLASLCGEAGIRTGTEEDLINLYKKEGIAADYLLSFYWKRAKASTIRIAEKGSINFHPGPLPEARGSGYHIAILEKWGYWGVTAHYMDEDFDTGNIIMCRKFEIPENIVNQDLVKMTHEQLFFLFRDVIESASNGERPKAEAQGEGTYYSLAQLEKLKFVHTGESIEEIDRKIRAFWNPPHSGAQIEVNGKNYTIINDEILNWIARKLTI